MIPEQIAVYFVCPLELEQVYATITYYLQNRPMIDDYLKRIDEKWAAALSSISESTALGTSPTHAPAKAERQANAVPQ